MTLNKSVPIATFVAGAVPGRLSLKKNELYDPARTEEQLHVRATMLADRANERIVPDLDRLPIAAGRTDSVPRLASRSKYCTRDPYDLRPIMRSIRSGYAR